MYQWHHYISTPGTSLRAQDAGAIYTELVDWGDIDQILFFQVSFV